MPKILIVSTLPVTISYFLLPFAKYFRKLGWQVDAMACNISAEVDCSQAFDQVWDMKWSRNPIELSNFFVTPQLIRKLVQDEKYDIVHVHTPTAAFVTRYALKDLKNQQKFKVIYTAHGFHFHSQGKSWKNSIYLFLEKMAGSWTDYLITINREDYAAANRYQLMPAKRIRYMPGIGVDLQYYNPEQVTDDAIEAVRQEMQLTAEMPLFLSIAEFTPRKRHRDLIPAFAKLARPDVHLALAGAGTLLEEMRQLAIDLGVEKQVHFLGKRQDISTLIRSSLATILVSAQEGLPRSVMESLSLEVVVIGSQIRGIQQLLEDDCGLLVELGNVDQITQAMAWVLANPLKSQEMGKRGREKMAAYALPQIINLHEALYTEAIGNHFSPSTTKNITSE
jgi:glycosyltransferase involved in cell wall biosynthesis